MRRIVSGIVIVTCLTGCAITSVDGDRMRLKSDRFADYVETVFRRQNEISIEMASEIDDEGLTSARYSMLDTLDRQLLVACRGMNELARAKRNAEPVRGLGGLKRARGAPDCERATNEAAAALESAP